MIRLAVLAARSVDHLAPVRDDTGAAADAARDPHTWTMPFPLHGSGTGAFVALLTCHAARSAVTRVVHPRRPAAGPATTGPAAEGKPRLGHAEEWRAMT